jgi:glyoxylase-like metal-dependent hydrolase (beta-lactamase superfamily II)
MTSRARIATAVLGLALATAGAHAQEPVESWHVQGNVHLLLGAGANAAVQIGEDGVLVVDTGAAASREALLAAIRKLSDAPIRWIINTNGDLDHTT